MDRSCAESLHAALREFYASSAYDNRYTLHPRRLGELAREVRLFEQVARQNGDAVKDALGGGVGLRQLEDQGVRVLLADGDGLAGPPRR